MLDTSSLSHRKICYRGHGQFAMHFALHLKMIYCIAERWACVTTQSSQSIEIVKDPIGFKVALNILSYPRNSPIARNHKSQTSHSEEAYTKSYTSAIFTTALKLYIPIFAAERYYKTHPFGITQLYEFNIAITSMNLLRRQSAQLNSEYR